MKTNIVFKKGNEIVAEIKGFAEVSEDAPDFERIAAGVSDAERLLERLTGYRVHIEDAD